MYRIRYVSDSGPVQAGNRKGWPAASKSFKSLFAALKAIRDVVRSNARVGTELGVGLQVRIPGGPWTWISTKDVERYAQEMRISDWKSLKSARK